MKFLVDLKMSADIHKRIAQCSVYHHDILIVAGWFFDDCFPAIDFSPFVRNI